ncbi:MAG: MarR family transcriptional regulator [Bacteroidales bacterium]|jgi:DNA-binding MarR family transcriptional regulator|nr:MarR family transcriptional regulator [Bacteroidales bacterium]
MINNTELKKLLLAVPIKLCRNMDHQFVKSILKDLQLNISQQHFMILKLLETHENLYISEFVEKLNITKPQMTSLLDKLIELDFISRTTDQNDRRKIVVTTTQSGKKLLATINKAIDIQLDNYLIELSQEELSALENGLKVLQKLCVNCN